MKKINDDDDEMFPLCVMCNAQLQQGWWWGRGDGRKPLALLVPSA